MLLAEDNLVNQQVAVGLLTKRGHQVTVTSNGREALEAIERDTFDVVLMDLQMPEMGGFETTAAVRFRERETGDHLRIIAMTAHAMSGDRERCLAAGMDGYLPKPIDRQMLFAIVENVDSDEAVPAGASKASLPDVFDSAALLERLGGDEKLFAKIIGMFLEDCPARLTAIKQAVDAGSRRTHPRRGARAERLGGQSVGLESGGSRREARGDRRRRAARGGRGRVGTACGRSERVMERWGECRTGRDA